MKSVLTALVVLVSFNAFAWNVNCGDRTIYYSSGATLKTQGGTFYYKNGATMFTQGGTGYYESGATMKTQGDTLYYKNGATLKTQGGTYYYENGATARTQGGTLYRKDGSQTQIPFSINLELGTGVSAEVDVSKGTSADSDIEIVTEAGPGERIKMRVSPSGINCTGLGEETEFTVTGRAGSAQITVAPGHDEDAISEAVKRALDTF
jgi:hypothetical protein